MVWFYERDSHDPICGHLPKHLTPYCTGLRVLRVGPEHRIPEDWQFVDDRMHLTVGGTELTLDNSGLV